MHNNVSYDRNGKTRGEYAELQFLVKAVSQQFAIAIPWRDSLPYDFILDSGSRRTRVQIKSAFRKHRNAYYLSVRCNGKNYRTGQIDALVGFIVPENAWYVFPVSLIADKIMLSLFPHIPHSRSRYEQYRDAWHLLR